MKYTAKTKNFNFCQLNFDLKMKFLLYFFSFTLLQVSANSHSQNKKISLNLENTTVENVLREIERLTEYKFFYKDSEVDFKRQITAKFKNKKVSKILKKIFSDVPVTFELLNKQIILKKSSKKLRLKSSIQQQIEVKGSVKDIEGVPIIGVNVLEKGTLYGTETDFDGKFKLKIKKGAVLEFSYLGFESQSITVGNQKEFNIIMIEAKVVLNEVVITGFQEIERRKLSSSVVSLESSEVEKAANYTIDNMLQGKVAGLAVLNSTSTPGAVPKIRIRGTSTISGSREPVWVVDGVILEDPVRISPSELNSLDNINIIGNAVSSLNPEDIERIDVLKDASSTALYGVRAANGVISITTKKGKKGPVSINYSTNTTMTQRPFYSQLNRLNSKQRIAVSKEAVQRGLTYTLEPQNIGYIGALQDYNAKNITYDQFLRRVKNLEELNTDWFGTLFRTAYSQTHNISISGANEKTNYYFSGGYVNNKGTFKYNGLSKYNGLMKINTEVNDKLNVGVQLRAAVNSRNYQHGSIDPFQYAYKTSRAIPVKNDNGTNSFYSIAQGFGQPLTFNILNELDNSEKTINGQAINFLTNFSYKITDDLKINGLMSYDKSSTLIKEWFNDKTYIASDLRGLDLGVPLPTTDFFKRRVRLPYGGGITNDETKQESYSLRVDLNYKKTFLNKHSVNFLLGAQLNSNTYDGLKTTQFGYLPSRGHKFIDISVVQFPLYQELLNENKDVISNNISKQLGVFGVVSYGYDDKYIANFNMRVDGSNKFGQSDDNKFLPVWSASGRWNAHNESFLENISWLDQFALRASYGVQGNVAAESPNLVLRLAAPNSVSNQPTSFINSLENPFLRWEKTTTTNFGVDFSFFEGRFGGTVEYYNKKSEDLIIPRKVSTTTGSDLVTINGGNLLNKGWDFTLNFTPIRTENFNWDVSINGFKNTNEVTDAGSTDYNYQDYVTGNANIPGTSIGTFYSYKFDKLDKDGLPTFKDTEETNGITKDELFKKAFVKSGSVTPDIQGGFSNNFKYKNWRLSSLFTYSLGAKVRLNPLYKNAGQTLPQPDQNLDGDYINRWQKPGDEEFTNIPVLSTNPLKLSRNREIKLADNKWEMYNYSDLRVASANYLRLSAVTLEYALPKSIIERIDMSNVTLRMTGNNLYTLKDKKLKGQEPDQVSFRYNTGAIPLAKSFTLGLNLTF